MDVGVAGVADDQCLATPRCHDSHPIGRLRLSELLEVGERADLVHLHLFLLPADLASSGQEAANHLSVPGDRRDRLAVPKDRSLLPLERDTTEPGDERLLALVTFDADLQALAWPVRRL